MLGIRSRATRLGFECWKTQFPDPCLLKHEPAQSTPNLRNHRPNLTQTQTWVSTPFTTVAAAATCGRRHGLTRRRWRSWWHGVEGFETLAFGPGTRSNSCLVPLSLSSPVHGRGWLHTAVLTPSPACAPSFSLHRSASLSLSRVVWCSGPWGSTPFVAFLWNRRGLSPSFCSSFFWGGS